MSSSPFEEPGRLDRLRRGVALNGSMRIARLALGSGFVSPEQYEEAIRLSERGGRRIEEIFLERKWIDVPTLEKLRLEARRLDVSDVSRQKSERMPPEAAQAAEDPANDFGRYVVVEKIGEGGMADVHRAWQRDLERWVALKILHLDGPSHRRFEQEARITAGLHHPHLLPVFEFGFERGKAFIAMAYASGGSLANRRLPFREAAQRIVEASEAAAEAHDRGIVHRDIKPSNLLLDSRGTLFLADFGLARASDGATDLTRAGVMMGTAAFAPPEQLRGQQDVIGPRTDVYSLGATLYALICGSPPFEGATLDTVVRKVIDEEPPSLRSRVPAVPRDLEIICGRALRKEPRERYDSARSLAEDLRRFLDGAPISAVPMSAMYRIRKRIARNPWSWISAAVVAALLAVVAPILYSTMRHNTEMSAELASKDEERRLDDLARQISESFYELSLQTGENLKRLEAGSAGGPPAPDPARILESIRKVVDGLAKKYPLARGPEAWWGLALAFSGKPREGSEVIEKACLEAGEDPFPHVLRARALLAAYCSMMKLPEIIGDGKSVRVDAFVESDQMRQHRELALKTLKTASSKKVWSRLTRGREYQAYASAMSVLEKNDSQMTWDRVVPLFNDPLLQGEAKLVGGFAKFMANEFREAAETWEQVPWTSTLCYASTAWLGDGLKERFAHRDPNPSFDRADERAADAMKRNPKFFAPVTTKAFVAMTRGVTLTPTAEAAPHFRRAIEGYTEAIRLGAGKASVRNRAICHRELAEVLKVQGKDPLEELTLAIADFEANMAQGPEPADAIQQRGVAHLMKGAWEFQQRQDPRPELNLALKHLDAALPGASDPAVCLKQRGMTYRTLAEVDMATQVDPRPNLERAIADLTQAIEKNPDGPEYRYARATAWLKRAEWEARTELDPRQSAGLAIADFTSVIAAGSTDLDAYNGRGLAYMTQGFGEWLLKLDPSVSFKNSLDDYDQGAILKPTNPEIYANRGLTLERMSRFEEARAAYRKTLELDPRHVLAKRRLEAIKDK